MLPYALPKYTEDKIGASAHFGQRGEVGRGVIFRIILLGPYKPSVDARLLHDVHELRLVDFPVLVPVKLVNHRLHRETTLNVHSTGSARAHTTHP